jgi:hypothetical protein
MPDDAKPNGRRPFRASEVGLVGRVSKARQAEDRMRADAWEKNREAELEAVVNRTYDGRDVPGIPELLTELAEVVKPYIAEFDRLFTAAYPAEFTKATLSIVLTPGGIDPKFREKVRRDATKHIQARKRYMLANSAAYATETLATTAQKATDNPEVHEILGKLAAPCHHAAP